MYVVIVGAGEVGFYIATILSQEGHDVAIIDRDLAPYQRAAEQLDVLAVRGNGASRRVLEQVNTSRADLLIAVTDSDEVNMIACMAAKRSGVAQTIARVRNPDYIEDFQTLSTGFTGVDHVIQPEAAVAAEVAKLATIPGALDVETFAAGRVWVLEVQVRPQTPCVGVALRDLGLPEGVVVTAILRGAGTTIPRGDTVIESGDRVFLTGRPDAATQAASLLTGVKGAPKKVLLLGCGEIGLGIALELERHRMKLTVFEKDPTRAAEAAGQLRRSLVLQDEGLDENILIEEGVAIADLFISATGDDRLNILSALMAKQLGAKRTIAIVERGEFSRVVETVGVDVAISPRRMTASAVLRFVRAGEVMSAAILEKSAGEVLELALSGSSRVCGLTLAEAPLPPGVIIGAVVRDEEVHIPDGRFRLAEGDIAVVFTLPESVREVEKLFAPRSRA